MENYGKLMRNPWLEDYKLSAGVLMLNAACLNEFVQLLVKGPAI